MPCEKPSYDKLADLLSEARAHLSTEATSTDEQVLEFLDRVDDALGQIADQEGG